MLKDKLDIFDPDIIKVFQVYHNIFIHIWDCQESGIDLFISGGQLGTYSPIILYVGTKWKGYFYQMNGTTSLANTNVMFQVNT